MTKPISLGISVEGQTEAYFVKYVLGRYLSSYNIQLSEPVILGGNVNFPRIEGVLYLMANQYDYVTTLYDFYGFQGKSPDDTYASLIEKIKTEGRLKDKNNIRPYIQMYEFEAILFSDLAVMCKYMDNSVEKVANYIALFQNDIGNKAPEDVNDSIQTAPSKRISKIFRRYKKTLYGYVIAQDIGITTIREKCPKFNAWVEELIDLSKRA